MADSPAITRSLIIKNSAFSIASWFFPIIVSLIATPTIIHGLGAKVYGIFALITGFVSYSFTFGIGKSAAKYVAGLRTSGDLTKMSEALSAVLIVSTAIGIFVIVLVSFTASWIVSDVLFIPAEAQKVATLSLFVASITILITMISQVFQYILQGLHRFDRFLLLTNIGGLVLTIGNVLLVLNGYGVFSLIVWNCVLVFLNAILFALAVNRVLPEFRPGFVISGDVWKHVIGYAASIIGYQVFGNILLLFERGWIARKFGTEAVTFYVVPMALCFYFLGLVSSVVVVLFPVVNELLQERDKLFRLYRTATKCVLFLTFLFVISISIGGKGLLEAWLGTGFSDASYWILVIHGFTFAIIAITSPAWQLTESFGVARANAVAGAVWLLISAPLMVVLSPTWQTEGVAAARLIGVFAFIPLIFYVERQFLAGFSGRFWPKVLFRLLVASVVAGIVEIAIGRAFGPGWVTLAFLALGGTSVFVGTLLLIGFVEEDEMVTLKDIFFRIRRSIWA